MGLDPRQIVKIRELITELGREHTVDPVDPHPARGRADLPAGADHRRWHASSPTARRSSCAPGSPAPPSSVVQIEAPEAEAPRRRSPALSGVERGEARRTAAASRSRSTAATTCAARSSRWPWPAAGCLLEMAQSSAVARGRVPAPHHPRRRGEMSTAPAARRWPMRKARRPRAARAAGVLLVAARVRGADRVPVLSTATSFWLIVAVPQRPANAGDGAAQADLRRHDLLLVLPALRRAGDHDAPARRGAPHAAPSRCCSPRR